MPQQAQRHVGWQPVDEPGQVVAANVRPPGLGPRVDQRSANRLAGPRENNEPQRPLGAAGDGPVGRPSLAERFARIDAIAVDEDERDDRVGIAGRQLGEIGSRPRLLGVVAPVVHPRGERLGRPAFQTAATDQPQLVARAKLRGAATAFAAAHVSHAAIATASEAATRKKSAGARATVAGGCA